MQLKWLNKENTVLFVGTGGIDLVLEPGMGNWSTYSSMSNIEPYVPPTVPDPLEQLANKIRMERNDLLSGSDWTQVADAPVDQAAWATYRQALRDITAQSGFPDSVVWPTKPE